MDSMHHKEKRQTGTAIDWQKRRRKISRDVLSLYVERPWPNVSIENIAENLGISYWQVYYSFDGQEDIYRSAVNQLVDAIVTEMASAPEGQTTVHGAIRDYVRHAAGIVGTENYKQLLFLRIRDESDNPWLRKIYQTAIGEPLARGLELAVENASAEHDLPVILLHGTSERYLRTLEAGLALPKLLHDDKVLAQEFERTIAAISKDVWASTCTFEGLENRDTAYVQEHTSLRGRASQSISA